jgi:hypothetical protein
MGGLVPNFYALCIFLSPLPQPTWKDGASFVVILFRVVGLGQREIAFGLLILPVAGKRRLHTSTALGMTDCSGKFTLNWVTNWSALGLRSGHSPWYTF